MKRKLVSLFAALGCFVAGTTQALAALSFYASQAAFVNANGQPTTVDFEHVAPAGGYLDLGDKSVPFRRGGLTFNDDLPQEDGGKLLIDGLFFGTTSSFLSSQQSSDGKNSLSIVFDRPTRAVALGFGSYLSRFTDTYLFTTSAGDSFSRSVATGGAFADLWLASSVPLTSLRLTTTGDISTDISRVQFVGVAPAPTAIVLLGTSVAGLLLLGWREQRKIMGGGNALQSA